MTIKIPNQMCKICFLKLKPPFETERGKCNMCNFTEKIIERERRLPKVWNEVKRIKKLKGENKK